jgi:peroxisomal 2,4-dienoyl-CoA reductase
VVDATVALLRGEGLEADGTNADVRSQVRQQRSASPAAPHAPAQADAERAVAFTVQRFGALDVLVNCAAGNFLALPEGATRHHSATVCAAFPSR